LQTQYRFTGQRLEQRLGAPEGGLDRGLYFYGARWYDSSLGRFLSPDSIVPKPGNPQSLNRYAYVLNNPLRYTDPTGHSPVCIQFAGVPYVGGFATLGCQVVQAIPQLIQLATNLSQFAASPQGQVALQLAQQANAGLNQAASNAGNAAGSGGLGPNDPWDKFNELLRQGKSEIDAAVQASTQGSGDRFVIGKYVSPEEFQRTGQMGYIQEVQARGGRYFDAGKTLWARLEKGGMAGEVNRQVIRRQMETGINRIELAGETIQQALSRKGSWTVEEIKWIREFARVFGYIEDATGWTKGP